MTDKLYDRIKSIASREGITIKQIQEDLHLARASMQNWNKVMPSIDKIQRVADYLGVSTSYLIGETEIRCQPEDILFNKDIATLQRGFEKLSQPEKERAFKLLNVAFEHAFDSEND